MTGPALQLHHGHVLRALEEIDLVELVAQGVIERARGIQQPPASRFVPDTGGLADAGDLVGVEDLDSGEVCVLPTSSLRRLRSVALTGLAVRELHPAGVVTAAVFGSSSAVRLHLSVIARMVPNLSHAAVYLGGTEPGEIATTLRDEFELAGIGLSISTNQRRAALGANLIVNADLGRYELAIGQLPPGALMVNAAGLDLPDEVLASVDHVYVDDLTLLEENRHRNVVKQHKAGRDHRPSQVHGQGEGLHRHRPLWRHQRHIEADLAQVLAGVRGRVEVDDVLLVDLLGEARPDITIAGRIHQVAVRQGLGWRFPDDRRLRLTNLTSARTSRLTEPAKLGAQVRDEEMPLPRNDFDQQTAEGQSFAGRHRHVPAGSASHAPRSPGAGLSTVDGRELMSRQA